MGIFKKNEKPAADHPSPAADQMAPALVAKTEVQSFDERQAAYAAAEREIASEHQSTLAELTRRKVAAEEHRDTRVAELEQRRADEHRAACVAYNTKTREVLAPVLSSLFEQLSNEAARAFCDAVKALKSEGLALLGVEGSAPRFAIEVIETFRVRYPGVVRHAIEPDFWKYNDFAAQQFLRCASSLWGTALSGNVAATRKAFEELEQAIYRIRGSGDPAPAELERWQARSDFDPTVGDRFEAALVARSKAETEEATRRQSEAWMRKQEVDRRARGSTGGRWVGDGVAGR